MSTVVRVVGCNCIVVGPVVVVRRSLVVILLQRKLTVIMGRGNFTAVFLVVVLVVAYLIYSNFYSEKVTC